MQIGGASDLRKNTHRRFHIRNYSVLHTRSLAKALQKHVPTKGYMTIGLQKDLTQSQTSSTISKGTIRLDLQK